METLKQYVRNCIGDCIRNYTNESLFDDEDTLSDPKRDKDIIMSWIKANYVIKGRIKINDDLTVDCSGDVDVKNIGIEYLTNGLFRWGKVGGSFDCTSCKNLKSLKGAPLEVGGDFVCIICSSIESLEGAPEKVGQSFYCSYCKSLKTLKGAPKEVTYGFDCAICNELTSLEGAPEEVGGYFRCTGCKKLNITRADKNKYKIML